MWEVQFRASGEKSTSHYGYIRARQLCDVDQGLMDIPILVCPVEKSNVSTVLAADGEACCHFHH